jgi:cyclopropane-fatty-acyl-phospholipid synthase
VSIEMLEAVGAQYFATFFEACDRALAPGGRMSLQSITFPDAAYESQRRGPTGSSSTSSPAACARPWQ